MQRLEVRLKPGESIYTEAGGMSWMKGNIQMTTDLRGGIIKGIKRALTGEPLFTTTYTCLSGEGLIVFTTALPGKILNFPLVAGQSAICQRGAFLCADNGVNLDIYIRHHIGAGLFDREGFILQRVTGPGRFFAEFAGEVAYYTLAEDEVMKINPGYLAIHEPSVDCNVALVRGVRNLLFGKEGVFLATLTGPGQVWLQTMPVANLADRLRPYILPKEEEG